MGGAEAGGDGKEVEGGAAFAGSDTTGNSDTEAQLNKSFGILGRNSVIP